MKYLFILFFALAQSLSFGEVGEAVNNGVNVVDAKESYSKTVNQLLIEQQFAATVFDSTQLHVLKTIATLCPYIEGPAVYLARALVYPYDRIEYSNSCEEFIEDRSFIADENITNDIKEINVYPNPTSNELFVDIEIREKQTGRIVIFDIAGANVLEEQLTNTSSINKINTAKLNSGIYLYKIFIGNEAVLTDKLVIIK